MRRAVVAVALLAAAGALGAAWFVSMRQDGSGDRSATPQDQNRGSTPQGAPRPDQPTAALHLDTDPPGTVVAGTPVFFSVTLERPGAAAADDAWLTTLRFETPDAVVIAWPVRRLGASHLIDRFTRIRYGIDPDASGRIPPGTYLISAAARLDGAPVTSDTVQLQVTASGELAPSPERLLQVGRFHLEAGEFDRAHAIALKLVEAADDTEAYILLGDALVGLRRDEEAIAAYTEALASIRDSQTDEPPDRILTAIDRAYDRLEASGRSNR